MRRTKLAAAMGKCGTATIYDVAPVPNRAAKLPIITEAQFLNQVIALAKVNRWLVAHFRPAREQGRDGQVRWRTAVQGDGAGWPDLVMLKAGRIIAAELKRDRRARVKPEQLAWLTAFEQAGAEAYLWRPDDWDTIVRVLEGRLA